MFKNANPMEPPGVIKDGVHPKHVERAQAAQKPPERPYEVTRDPAGALWLLHQGRGLTGGKVDIVNGMVQFSVPLEHVPLVTWEELEARLKG